jgi:exonuclease III
MTGTNNHLSLTSLNISGLNSPIKRHKLTNWIHMQDPAFCCTQESHFNDRGSYYLRVKDWKKVFQANGPNKKAGVLKTKGLFSHEAGKGGLRSWGERV